MLLQNMSFFKRHSAETGLLLKILVQILTEIRKIKKPYVDVLRINYALQFVGSNPIQFHFIAFYRFSFLIKASF